MRSLRKKDNARLFSIQFQSKYKAPTNGYAMFIKSLITRINVSDDLVNVIENYGDCLNQFIENGLLPVPKQSTTLTHYLLNSYTCDRQDTDRIQTGGK